jgi:hypothetical protein
MDTVLCLALITGTQELTLASNWADADNYAYLTAVMDRADEFGLSKGRAEFIGWWANAPYLDQMPADPKMKCALWKGDGKALLMLGNAHSGVDGTTTITVKPEALGLTGDLVTTDWWTREPVPMEGARFTIEVKGSSWRMIAITSRAATEAKNLRNGYGWALSRTVADNSFICIASRDGQWVLGTFFDPVKQLSFNTKGKRIHGCIHSSPQLPAVPPGKVEVCRGRLYLRPGTPQSLWQEYRTIEARSASGAEVGP